MLIFEPGTICQSGNLNVTIAANESEILKLEICNAIWLL